MTPDEVAIQREYYARTAAQYDELHVSPAERDEHYLALAVMSSLVRYHQAGSVLDVGAGTGRTLLRLRADRPDLRLLGVEPVAALRAEGYRKGLTPAELVDGDATNLPFADGAFDVVCAFAVLHHIPRPERAIREMLRVARVMVFISDCNNFAQGGWLARTAKQAINAVGLWRVADFVKTRGRGYTISEGDGLAYSYSVFQDLPLIRSACRTVHLMNTGPTLSANLYRGAGTLAVAGIK